MPGLESQLRVTAWWDVVITLAAPIVLLIVAGYLPGFQTIARRGVFAIAFTWAFRCYYFIEERLPLFQAWDQDKDGPGIDAPFASGFFLTCWMEPLLVTTGVGLIVGILRHRRTKVAPSAPQN